MKVSMCKNRPLINEWNSCKNETASIAESSLARIKIVDRWSVNIPPWAHKTLTSRPMV